MESSYKQIVTRQKAFFETGQTLEIDFRIHQLKRLKKTVADHYDPIVEALRKDLHKSEFESIATEVMCIMDELNLVIRKLRSWAKPQRVKTPLSFFKASSKYYYEPYGCVLIIGAWNYPVSLSLIPVINAIAAGNCCIIKPSEVSPHSSSIINKIIKACFDQEYCIVCEGGAQETTYLLAAGVDFIHYTGGLRVGKIVAEAAAKQLIPTVLELGGKSPCIVDQTAHIQIAARRICWGKFTNAGQTCVAPDYILVHESIRETFVEAMQKTLQDFYGENPLQHADYANIVNEQHFDRLVSLLYNEKIIHGGVYERKNLCIAPTLVELFSKESKLMEEEIFGPILPIMTYRDLSEVTGYINGTHKNPLALYLFSTDKKTQNRILREIPFGGGCINSVIMHTGNPYLPFGGIGNSGIGNYHGRHGFETFSHKKGILKKSNLIDMSFLYPPFGKRAKLLKRFVLR